MHEHPQQWWLWVTYPRFAQDQDDPEQDRPDLSPGDTGDYWTCHEDTRAGDLAMLYVTDPFMEVRWLFSAESAARSLENDADAQREGWTHGCEYLVLARVRQPLTFQEMKQDQQLQRWDAIHRNLHGQGGSWPAPSSHWDRLMRRVVGRNADTRGIFAGHMRPVPGWLKS